MAVLKEAAHQLQDSVPSNTPSCRANLATPLDLPTCCGGAQMELGGRGNWRDPDHAPASSPSSQREGTQTVGWWGSGRTPTFRLVLRIQRVDGPSWCVPLTHKRPDSMHKI